MSPVSPDNGFWAHMPTWLWPIIIVGVLAFFLFEAIKAYEAVAKHLGPLGRYIHNNALPKRLDRKLDRMERSLERTSDRLECAMAYLTKDAEWHQDADVIIAENCPDVAQLLPVRVPFTEFSRRWTAGDRPYYEE